MARRMFMPELNDKVVTKAGTIYLIDHVQVKNPVEETRINMTATEKRKGESHYRSAVAELGELTWWYHEKKWKYRDE